jgi:polyisoprenoid-binding protein YceI
MVLQKSQTTHWILSLILVALTFGTGSSLYSAEKFTLDASHSTVEFAVRHMVLSTVKGQFSDISGTILYDENDLSRSSIEVVIKVASINTNNAKRDDHLKSPDFFDAGTFPEITFKSTKIEKTGDSYLLTGTLTMRNVTKEISFPFEVTGRLTDPWGNIRMGAEASLKINRQDYGISWSKTLDGGGLVVGDEVKIGLSVEAIKRE